MASQYLFLWTLSAFLQLPEGKLNRMTWHAPVNDPHVRRLSQQSTATDYTVTVRVVKQDAFGPEPARVDVAFVPPGHSESELVTVSFPGTNGNAGTQMPMGLQHGASVNISGYTETDTTQADALKAGMKDQRLAAGLSSAKGDKRGVFVAQSMEFERDAGELGGRRLAGNAASQNTAVVVLYEPCGNSLQDDITKDRLESGFFSTNTGSFQQVIGVCSRGTVSFTGSVVGPISGCPGSDDAWTDRKSVV